MEQPQSPREQLSQEQLEVMAAIREVVERVKRTERELIGRALTVQVDGKQEHVVVVEVASEVTAEIDSGDRKGERVKLPTPDLLKNPIS